MFFTALHIAIFSTLALASSGANFLPPQANNMTLKVTNFTAFMADPYVEGAQSNLSFHLVDTRPEYYAEVDCVIPPTYFSLYAITALFEYCGNRSLNFMFLFQEGRVAVRRGWTDETGNSFTGTATQVPYWNENGANANVTITTYGKLYTRKSEWLFPVNSFQSAS